MRHIKLRWSTIVLCLVGGATQGLQADTAGPEPYTYLHHPVSTNIPAAQFAFDRGLTMVVAYEQDEGERSFREAARLDPSLAMAWWGVALAVGPNINDGPELKSTGVAAEAIKRAKLLADKHATAEEREYIEALSARYTSDEKPDYDKLAIAYREAMRNFVHAHPQDADARALYAEAIMDLHPWDLWSTDGKPGPDTTELVDLLESGLKQNPDHIGLLHFYIHAVEASPDPQRGLLAAHRLEKLPMEPAEHHLVHMPSHIYLPSGDWMPAVEANEHAEHYAHDYRVADDPKSEFALCGHYGAFATYAYMMLGNESRARELALEGCKGGHKDPALGMAVLLRFHAWEDVLAFPEPTEDWQSDFWHFGRGVAFVALGRLDRAEKELKVLQPDEAPPAPAPTATSIAPATGSHCALDIEQSGYRRWGAMSAGLTRLETTILRARLALARGQLAQATELLREAVKAQDGIPYGEPPAWFYPVRESLGAVLLKRGDIAGAEATFSEGARLSPNDPRMLLGLSEAQRAAGHTADAARTRQEFVALWQGPRDEPKVAAF